MTDFEKIELFKNVQTQLDSLEDDYILIHRDQKGVVQSIGSKKSTMLILIGMLECVKHTIFRNVQRDDE